MKTSCLVPLLAALVIAQPAAAAPFLYADFRVDHVEEPLTLNAGVSGTFEVTVGNFGGQAGSLELFIIFTGAVDQTGQIVAPGFDCELRHDSGINAAIRCTTPSVEPVAHAGVREPIIFQGRGQAAGTGKIGVVLNPGRSTVEGNYDDNNYTFEVTIR